MDHTRLAYFRRALRAKGYDAGTIAMVEKSWQPGTVKGYESYWRRWRTFASDRGQDPAARNDAELTNWLSTLVHNELKEGSLEIARTSVSTLWDYVDDIPGVISARIAKAAKKQNGAKSNGRSDVWDLPYLFEYVDKEDIDEMQLPDLTSFVIARLKGFSGWRSADLTGIYHDISFDFIPDPADNTKIKALRVRNFSSKVQKGQWSPWLTLPILHDRLKHICPARALLQLVTFTRGLDIPTVAAQHPDTGAQIQAKPLFIYKTRSGYAQLKADSVASKFRKLFLENVTTQRGGNDIKLSVLYTAHTSRNAVASALNDMDVPANNIAAHMNTTADNLRSTYITTVLRDWELPRACIAHHEQLAAKLAVPYAHYLATQGDASRACNCNDLFASVPQP